MIDPKCSRCHKELDKFGAILYSPPDKEDLCLKSHLCVRCYDYLIDFFLNNSDGDTDVKYQQYKNQCGGANRKGFVKPLPYKLWWELNHE